MCCCGYDCKCSKTVTLENLVEQEENAWKIFQEAKRLLPNYHTRTWCVLYGNLEKGQTIYGPFKHSEAVRISEKLNNRGYRAYGPDSNIKHRVTFATVVEMKMYEP